jgi:mycothiol system anti-sigma-R factor
MIDCPEAVRRMWDYLDQGLEARPLEELEDHLATCTRCCGELEFNRHLRQMVAERQFAPIMPPELRSRVETLLAEGDELVEEQR